MSGLFDSFDNLDQIQLEDIARWLKVTPNMVQLENYLANKILYPQSVPLTQADMEVDLAILREALRINGPKSSNNALLGDNTFLNITLRKILIPTRFLPFLPSMTAIVWAFVDAFLLNRKKEDYFEDLWTVVLTGEIDEIVGSVLLPQFNDNNAVMELKLENESYKIRPGSLMVIPCKLSRCQIGFKFKGGKVLGKEESDLEIYGGRLGLMIDGRSVK